MKTLQYKNEFGTENVGLRVGLYANNKSLYIGLVCETGEYYGDLTVNLPPGNPLRENEAFLSDDGDLPFVVQHGLGKVLPDRGYSGFCSYTKVAFDLELLKEFDPNGIKEFLKHRDSLENCVEDDEDEDDMDNEEENIRVLVDAEDMEKAQDALDRALVPYDFDSGDRFLVDPSEEEAFFKVLNENNIDYDII